MNKLLVIYFVILFNQGLFQIFGITPTLYKILAEIMIFLMLFYSLWLTKKKGKPFRMNNNFMGIWLIIFIVINFISIKLNDAELLNSYSFVRNTTNSLIFYIAVSNYTFTNQQLSKLLKIIFGLILIQPFASLVKLLTIGRSEDYTGTIAISGGSYSTIFPLMAITLLYFLFLYYKRRSFYLFFIIGFMFTAFVGDKRAFWFFMPMFIFICYNIYLRYNGSGFNWGKGFTNNIVIIVLLAPIIVYAGGRLLPSLNPDNKVGGSFDLQYLSEYAREYNTGERTQSVNATGRVGGLIALIESIGSQNEWRLLFGNGPDFLVDKSNEDDVTYKFKVALLSQYTGLMFYLSSVGILGSIFLLLFYTSFLRVLFRKLKIISNYNRFFRALTATAFVLVLICLLDFLSYTKTFVHSNLFNSLLFLIIALINNSQNKFIYESNFRL